MITIASLRHPSTIAKIDAAMRKAATPTVCVAVVKNAAGRPVMTVDMPSQRARRPGRAFRFSAVSDTVRDISDTVYAALREYAKSVDRVALP